MCKYCEKGKKIEEVENDNIYFTIFGRFLRVHGRVLSIPLGRTVPIEYCPMCRKEAGRVSTEKPIERPIELLRKISKEIYDNEFYIETAILSYQAQEEKTYTFFRDDEQKDELRKYSWCQRPDSTNMSLKRFTENGEIEGYMSESLAEHYGLQKVDLNEFIHKFVKPLVKYKFEEDKQ